MAPQIQSAITATSLSATTFTYDVQLTDEQPHAIALYFLDWDSGGIRTQTVDLLDASTAALLDSRLVANFSGGVYLVWEVSGHVQIRVTNNLGANATVSGVFFDPVSAPPTVSLTSPANNATFTAPATVPLAATASDSDGTVTLVEFFQGATKIGEDATAPYSLSWSNVTAGPYTLTAKATDSGGATTTSFTDSCSCSLMRCFTASMSACGSWVRDSTTTTTCSLEAPGTLNATVLPRRTSGTSSASHSMRCGS